MKRMSERLTCYLVRKGSIKKEDYEIYNYGFQLEFEIVLSFLASLGIALYLNMLQETVLFFALFIPLRAFAGGFHFKKYLLCFIGSNVSLFTILVLVKNVDLLPRLSVIFYLILTAAIKYLSHLKNTEPELDKRYYSRKLNAVILFFSILIAFLYILHKSKYLFLIAAVMFLETITLLFKIQNEK
jgi:accessory gene regulator B